MTYENKLCIYICGEYTCDYKRYGDPDRFVKHYSLKYWQIYTIAVCGQTNTRTALEEREGARLKWSTSFTIL